MKKADEEFDEDFNEGTFKPMEQFVAEHGIKIKTADKEALVSYIQEKFGLECGMGHGKLGVFVPDQRERVSSATSGVCATA